MAKEILPKQAADALRDLAAGKLLIGWPDGNKSALYATYNKIKSSKDGTLPPPVMRPVSLALIARTLNYGRKEGVNSAGGTYGEIPPRPFLNLAMENIKKEMPSILKKWLPLLLSGKIGYNEFMAYLGQRCADELKDAMSEGKWEPNAAITISGGIMRTPKPASKPFMVVGKRGGNKPLFDSGTLANSISFEIKK